MSWRFSVWFNCALNTATSSGPTKTIARPPRSYQSGNPKRAGSRRESRSRDTKTVICQDFSLPPRQEPSRSARHEAFRRYFMPAMRIPRTRLRSGGILSRRNRRSRERITRRPSSKLSRVARERPARVYIGRISPRLYDFVERRWAEAAARAPERDGRGARKRSFVSGTGGNTSAEEPLTIGATIELCISHETLRETDPFVIRGT